MSASPDDEMRAALAALSLASALIEPHRPALHRFFREAHALRPYGVITSPWLAKAPFRAALNFFDAVERARVEGVIPKAEEETGL